MKTVSMIATALVLTSCTTSLDAYERDIIAPNDTIRNFNLKGGDKGGAMYQDVMNCNAYIFTRCLTEQQKIVLDQRLEAKGRR